MGRKPRFSSENEKVNNKSLILILNTPKDKKEYEYLDREKLLKDILNFYKKEMSVDGEERLEKVNTYVEYVFSKSDDELLSCPYWTLDGWGLLAIKIKI